MGNTTYHVNFETKKVEKIEREEIIHNENDQHVNPEYVEILKNAKIILTLRFEPEKFEENCELLKTYNDEELVQLLKTSTITEWIDQSNWFRAVFVMLNDKLQQKFIKNHKN